MWILLPVAVVGLLLTRKKPAPVAAPPAPTEKKESAAASAAKTAAGDFAYSQAVAKDVVGGQWGALAAKTIKDPKRAAQVAIRSSLGVVTGGLSYLASAAHVFKWGSEGLTPEEADAAFFAAYPEAPYRVDYLPTKLGLPPPPNPADPEGPTQLAPYEVDTSDPLAPVQTRTRDHQLVVRPLSTVLKDTPARVVADILAHAASLQPVDIGNVAM